MAALMHAGPPADREAADREADAERRRTSAPVARAARGRRRRRAVADQHAARGGDRSRHRASRGWAPGSGGLSGPGGAAGRARADRTRCAARDGAAGGRDGRHPGRAGDALDFIAAGASCVAVGTESFRDPAAGDARARRAARELQRALRCAACDDARASVARRATARHESPANAAETSTCLNASASRV